MEIKTDMPHWNKFLNDVLSKRAKVAGKPKENNQKEEQEQEGCPKSNGNEQ